MPNSVDYMGRMMNRAIRILRENPTHVAGWGSAVAALALFAAAFQAAASKAEEARSVSAAASNLSVDSTKMITSLEGLTETMAKDFLSEPKAVSPVGAALINHASDYTQQRYCLAQAIYYESRSEGKDGQKAVAEVILNRAASKHYPSSICGVIFQGSQRSTGCQFSFTCDGSMDRAPKGKTWERAQKVAELAMTGGVTPITGRATHYHNLDVTPAWSNSLVLTKTIETHKFYRTRWRERGVSNAGLSVAPPSP